MSIDWCDKPSSNADLAAEFAGLAGKLLRVFSVSRGMLAIRDEEEGALTITATWRAGGETRSVKLRLPRASSLFERVVQDGRMFSENYCGCFSGNSFERRILLDDDSRSYVLQPLKQEGSVIGVLGFSSENPDTFAVADDLMEKLAAAISARVRDGLTAPLRD
jgi:transcriptional regulator with GAF, ATPase, and Fis domain